MDVKPFKAIQVTATECDFVFEKMLRRFTRRFRESGIVEELRDRRGFVKPSQVRRRRRSKTAQAGR